jgi:fatty acid desaturase
MDLRPNATYVRELRPRLPASAFAPARSRLWWLPVHVAVIAALAAAIATGWLPGPLVPLASIVIGVSFAGLTFLGHETLHGAVVRGKRTRHLVGWIGFLPFVLSPRLWVVWHNREHHGRTNQYDLDPDLYPTLRDYHEKRAIRVFIDGFALGSSRWNGVLSLLLGFTGQSIQVLIGGRRWMPARQHRLAIAETVLGVLVWLAVAVAVGPLAFLFVFGLPLLLANTIVMAYILTNHSLSPMTAVNDPLINSLTVTVPRPVEWLTLGFGYHVEHHLFPAMSTRHAPQVRALLQERWPERYQSMPLHEALLALHRTYRVYRDDVTLVNPRSGQVWPVLRPR